MQRLGVSNNNNFKQRVSSLESENERNTKIKTQKENQEWNIEKKRRIDSATQTEWDLVPNKERQLKQGTNDNTPSSFFDSFHFQNSRYLGYIQIDFST